MGTQSQFGEIFDPGLLGKWLAKGSDIWQMDLLDDRGLSRFAKDRAVDFRHDHIRQLWQLRLLRADLVTSTRKLRSSGLIEVETNELGQHVYADNRPTRRRKRGWLSAAAKLIPVPLGITPYFHPFRYYILYHFNRILKINIPPMQALIAAERYPNLLEIILSFFQNWSSGHQFLETVHRWDIITALAIATEPCMYERVFKSLKFPPWIGFEEQRKHIEKHWKEVVRVYRKAGLETIEKFRQELCINAELLDPNKNVHTILRLTAGGFRPKIKGRLGGALHLLTMAEILRRAAEEVFGIKLREEDELGFGMTPPDMKKKFYGSDRILEGDRTATNEFLRQFRLDYGVRLRWYVEGETEYGALESILGRYTAIDLVNLRGSVVQKGGKGVSFRDSLRSDLKLKVFSLVLIDKDNEYYVRALRKAAESDEICGMVFLSDPDFEFGNFTQTELEEILWEIATENGATYSARGVLHQAVVGVKSAKELWDRAKLAVPELLEFDKGIRWGEKLMEFAWNNPELRDKTSGKAKTRPVIEATRIAIRGVSSNYLQSRRKYRIDPLSLVLVERKDQIR